MTRIAAHYISYSINTLFMFGAVPLIVRFVFAGFLAAAESRSWTIVSVVLAITGAAEGLSIAMVQSRFPPCSDQFFPIKLWYWTMAIGSVFAWVFVLGPTLSLVSALSSFNLIDNTSTIAFILIAGALFGGIIGTAQYVAYRGTYSNGEVLIVAKSVEWICLTVVSLGALMLLKTPIAALSNAFVMINACLLSGAIQVFARNATCDMLHAR